MIIIIISCISLLFLIVFNNIILDVLHKLLIIGMIYTLFVLTNKYIYTRPTTKNTNIQPTTKNTHTQPTTNNTHIQPTTKNTHIQPTTKNTHTQPTTKNTYTQQTTKSTYNKFISKLYNEVNIYDDFIEYMTCVYPESYNIEINNIKSKLDTNKLISIFDIIIKNNNLNELFEFGIKYGFLDMVHFLYKYKNIKYDYDLVTQYCELDNDNIPKWIHVVNNKTKLDKITIDRNKCICYLLDMKKQSTSTSKNGKFYYHYNLKN
jgi:hypothetical protein